MSNLILKAKITALKAARAAIIATLTPEELKIYEALKRKQLINGRGRRNGINYG